MNKHIYQAIEHTHAGLKPNVFLAEKIIAKTQKKPSCKWKTALVLSFALLIVTFTALALLPRKNAMTPGGMWTYNEGCLYYQSKEEKKPRLVLENENIILIASDYHNNALYYITRNNQEQKIEAVIESGTHLLPGRNISMEYSVQDFQISGGMAYLLADTQEGRGQIWRIHTYDDQTIKDLLLPSSGWKNEHISSFCISEDQILYTHSNQTGLFSAISLYDYTPLQNSVMVHNITSLLEGYKKDGVPYLFALSAEETPKLLILNTQTGEKMDTLVALPKGSQILHRDRNTLYVMNGEGNLLASYNIATLSGKQVLHSLTIVNGLIANTKAGEKAEELFAEKYPHVEIIHRTIDDPRNIATAMMADEGNIDIITLQPGMVLSSIPSLLQSGAILDVSQAEPIQAVKGDWRNIWNTVSVDGRQYGVPVFTFPYLWQVNEQVAGKLGWEIPEGEWTWAAFEGLMDRVIRYNEQQNEHLYLLADSDIVPFLIVQYEQEFIDPYQGTANYRTERFRHILQIWKKLNEQNLLYPYTTLSSGRASEPEGVPNTLLCSKNHLPLGALGTAAYILPPVWDDQTPYLATVFPMCISGNTPYPEEAAYFLACYASAEAASRQYIGNSGQWLKDVSLYSTSFLEPINEEHEQLWNHVLEKCEPAYEHKSLIRMHWKELLPAYLSGRISEEEYMETAHQQGNMFLGE